VWTGFISCSRSFQMLVRPGAPFMRPSSCAGFRPLLCWGGEIGAVAQGWEAEDHQHDRKPASTSHRRAGLVSRPGRFRRRRTSRCSVAEFPTTRRMPLRRVHLRNADGAGRHRFLERFQTRSAGEIAIAQRG